MTDKLQYYYKDNACPAEHSRAETCICWHDEGKGPFPDLKNGDAIPMAYGSAIGLAWRAAPQPAPETKPRRCAECDCEGGEYECNWIKPGPIRVVEGGDDAA